MRHSVRPLRRRAPALSPKPRFLIVCEGEVTEPSYFAGLRREQQIRLLQVVVDDAGGTPKSLVERAVTEKKDAARRAKSEKDENLKFDEIWCVFDIDEHPLILEAKEQARAHGISLAISNPCFELWLLLHFAEQRAWIHRHSVQSACRKYLKDYEKEVPFEQLRGLLDDALRRAEQLESWQVNRGCQGENPSTDMHKLVHRLRAVGKSESLKQIGRLQRNTLPEN
jgi:hypothetical protein